ncbi:MAG TPA: hypothetical protein VFA04_05735 [Bryobacteraceae bacterium]|nr:hypothetical protein [Bryobacteraceae bacterium]
MSGTAAATLIGLLFVAVTLNADLILAGTRPHVKRIAEQAFNNYVAVLIASLFLLIPDQRGKIAGLELASIGIAMGGWAIYRLGSALRAADESFSKKRTQRRLLPSVLGFLLLIASAAQLLLKAGDADALSLAGSGLLLLLIAATGTSWDLLVRVAEIRHSAEAKQRGI